MKRKFNAFVGLGALLSTLGGGIAATSAHAATASPAYLTILLGRTQEYPTLTPNCAQLPDTINLSQAAAAMYGMGIDATGAVIVDRTSTQASPTCVDGDSYPSWAQLTQLQQQDGMSFISAGIDYENNTKLTPAQAQANICGSLPAFTQHGQNRAAGLFAYPNNGLSPQLQTSITESCFDFGRTYGEKANIPADPQHWAVTSSITGGACSNPALPCYKLVTVGSDQDRGKTPKVYWSLPALESYMNPASGSWRIVQMYKFVTGSYRPGATSGATWDCTSPNWQNHYTSISETYCWNDFVTALKSIPAGTKVVDPETVAQAWGVSP